MPEPGLPDKIPVEEENETPDGKAPDSVTFGAGKPVVFTVKVPFTPTENFVAAPEVMAGPWSTDKVKCWTAGDPTPLLAVKITG